MSILYTIARPYSKAIFEIALLNNSVNEWKEMLIFISQIASYKRIKNFLSGVLSPKYLSSIFIMISDERINENGKNLIRLLSENQRFNILNIILEQFLELESLHKNVQNVELRSAFPLEKKQIVQITKILESFLLKKIKFIFTVDCYMLGGIIIKINNTIFDLSVRNRLQQLSHALNFEENNSICN